MNKTPMNEFLKKLAYERPKPFPEWNSVEDFQPPLGEFVLILDLEGDIWSYTASEDLTGDFSHWMYAPKLPLREPKRGVWVSIADGLPPTRLDVLVKGPHLNNFHQAWISEGGGWVFSYSNGQQVPDGIISHWYLPHKFEG